MFVQLLLFVIAHCGTPGPLVQVEVRSGSLAKLFLWSSLTFQRLAFPLEKPSRDILVVHSSGTCEMSVRRNQWQERVFWNGRSMDRVSGRRELLPSASEQILSPLRFQETRGGSGVCHFGFKAHPPAFVSFFLQVGFLGLGISFVCPASIVNRRPLWYAGPLVRVDVRSGLVD